jgi:hypothetical protein
MSSPALQEEDIFLIPECSIENEEETRPEGLGCHPIVPFWSAVTCHRFGFAG